MKTIMPLQVTEGMFFLNNNTESMNFINNKNSIRVESQSPIIESIIEVIVEPMIYKC